MRWRFFIVILSLLAAPSLAAAEEEVTTAPVRVRAEKEREAADADAERALDEPAFVTVVRVGDRRGEAISVAEVLAEAVGVRVRSLGGLGSFASISIRGAGSAQT